MRNYILFDDQNRENLLPLTYTKPVAALRVGIYTIHQKWSALLEAEPSYLTQPYLARKYPIRAADSNIMINAAVIPNKTLATAIGKLREKESIFMGETLVAVCVRKDELADIYSDQPDVTQWEDPIDILLYPWDIFSLNGREILNDFNLITQGRESAPVPKSVQVFGQHPVFIEEGAQLRGAIINTEEGPVYIGKEAEVMEGALIRGPFALCDYAQVKMGAKIYGNTTFGPHSKVGGELNNVVIQAYSNKAHDGFIGHSVIGEWCNIGADTNSSNLKNTYAEVRMWNYPSWRFISTGLQFCGLIMGDHSKCSINTMFNTGTVVGVSANLFGSGFHRNFFPSFSWGGPHGMQLFDLEKAMEVAETVMSRRGIVFDDIEREIFRHLHEHTRSFSRR